MLETMCPLGQTQTTMSETIHTSTDTLAAAAVREPDRLLLRGREVAQLLGISRALAFRWMQEGKLPVIRMPGSRTVRVPRAALLEFIERRTKAPKE